VKKFLLLAFALSTAMASPAALAAGGCGPGWHRGPHGHCLRNYVRPAYHPCPRGYHLNRYHRCRPNY
jgi:hypothetical protein